MKERLIQFLAHLSMGQNKFEKKVGLSTGFVNNIGDSIRVKSMQKILSEYPELNQNWLLTGEGSMLKSAPSIGSEDADSVPLLPISAQGGSLNDFAVSVKNGDCEQIISPIKGVDFAITVSGDSMAPEYPNGSQILIKKINEKAFIDWGRVYVLDTCNGVVVKTLAPSEKDGYVKCMSINPDPKYAPFEIAFDDIHGVYRVMMCMSVK